MNIGSIGANSALDHVRKAGASNTAASSHVEGESDQVKLSKPAEALKKLETLKQDDPAKFKAVMADIADKLDEAASSASGKDAERLADMASKFANAAGTGDLTALTPPVGGGSPVEQRGGAHRARGAGGPPPPPPPQASTDADGDHDGTKSVASANDGTALDPSTAAQNKQAVDAYKRHQDESSVFRTALDNAMSMVEDATSKLAV